MHWEQNNNRLKSLLQEELSCFKEILYQTQEYHKILNRGTTNALLDLLDEREIRIDLINRLENERRKLELNTSEYEPVINSIKKDIKDIALNLVRVDAELLNILAMTKEGIIKQLSKTNNKKILMNNHRNEPPRIFDIKQE